MNGFAPADNKGNYKRPEGLSIDKNVNLNAINGEIFLLVGNSCPWCHRTLLAYQIKNLTEDIKVIYLQADHYNGQWIFKKKFQGFKTLSEVYKRTHKRKIFRSTLPVLISSQKNLFNILSNESTEITKLLNSFKSKSSEQTLKIKNCDKKLLKLIHNDINDGVYKCGFARSQSSYERASKALFNALNKINKILEKKEGKWICGKELSYADIYLFPTLIRWELIYSKLFKCTEREISDFKNISKWRNDFFKLSNIPETCFENEWTEDYYRALFPLNPNQIVPISPSLKEIIKLESQKFLNNY